MNWSLKLFLFVGIVTFCLYYIEVNSRFCHLVADGAVPAEGGVGRLVDLESTAVENDHAELPYRAVIHTKVVPGPVVIGSKGIGSLHRHLGDGDDQMVVDAFAAVSRLYP